MHKPEILIPLLTLKSNGGGIVVMELSRSILRQGGRVTIVTSNYHGDEIARFQENAGIKFLVTPALCGRHVSSALLLVYGSIYSFVHKPILLYTHTVTTLIPNFSDKQPIWLAQDIEYKFFKKRLKLVFKVIIKRAINKNKLIITSNWLGRFFRRVGSKIIYSNNIGISQKIFKKLNSKKNNTENYDVLIIAKKGSHKRGFESRALAKKIAEFGTRVLLIDQIGGSRHGLSGSLEVVGAVEHQQMIQYLLASRIFVNISSSEGYGLVPLEALAAGCRVISTPTPSLYKVKNSNLYIIKEQNNIIEESINLVKRNMNTSIGPDVENKIASEFFLEDWANCASKKIIDDVYI